MKYIILIIFNLLLVNGLFAQQGFKEQIAIEIDEPSSGYHVLEDTINKQYLVSGVYFDQEIGRWTANVSNFDLQGNRIGLHPLRSDTVPFLDFSNNSVLNDNKYYMVGLVRLQLILFNIIP